MSCHVMSCSGIGERNYKQARMHTFKDHCWAAEPEHVMKLLLDESVRMCTGPLPKLSPSSSYSCIRDTPVSNTGGSQASCIFAQAGLAFIVLAGASLASLV